VKLWASPAVVGEGKPLTCKLLAAAGFTKMARLTPGNARSNRINGRQGLTAGSLPSRGKSVNPSVGAGEGITRW